MKYFSHKTPFSRELRLVDHQIINDPYIEIVIFNYKGLDFTFSRNYSDKNGDWEWSRVYFKGDMPDFEAELEHILPVWNEAFEYLRKVDNCARPETEG